MLPLGTKLRQQRRRLGMTLDDLATKASISKPYLSLIETGRVPNPPSDEKLQRLERSLGFNDGELISHAYLQRTPLAVRAILSQLLQKSTGSIGSDDQQFAKLVEELTQMMDGSASRSTSSPIPVINTSSTGYPRGFFDLSFPMSAATDFIVCLDVDDKDAFAIRVINNRMAPRYHPGDIVIFSPALKARNGDDCFVCFDDGDSDFQRVFFEKDDAGQRAVRLQPRNETYRARTIPVEKVAATYRAVVRQHKLSSPGK